MKTIQQIELLKLEKEDVAQIDQWPKNTEELADLDSALRPSGWLDANPEPSSTRRYKAVTDGKLIGFSLLTDINAGAAEIFIAVKPGLAGKEIEWQLTKLTLERGFSELGLNRVYRKVRTRRKDAIELYRQFGFAITDQKTEVVDGETVDFQIMEFSDGRKLQGGEGGTQEQKRRSLKDKIEENWLIVLFGLSLTAAGGIYKTLETHFNQRNELRELTLQNSIQQIAKTNAEALDGLRKENENLRDFVRNREARVGNDTNYLDLRKCLVSRAQVPALANDFVPINNCLFVREPRVEPWSYIATNVYSMEDIDKLSEFSRKTDVPKKMSDRSDDATHIWIGPDRMQVSAISSLRGGETNTYTLRPYLVVTIISRGEFEDLFKEGMREGVERLKSENTSTYRIAVSNLSKSLPENSSETNGNQKAILDWVERVGNKILETDPSGVMFNGFISSSSIQPGFNYDNVAGNLLMAQKYENSFYCWSQLEFRDPAKSRPYPMAVVDFRRFVVVGSKRCLFVEFVSPSTNGKSHAIEWLAEFLDGIRFVPD